MGYPGAGKGAHNQGQVQGEKKEKLTERRGADKQGGISVPGS